jgi:hypothetical protein
MRRILLIALALPLCALAQSTSHGPIYKVTSGANKNNLDEDLNLPSGVSFNIASGGLFNFKASTKPATPASGYRLYADSTGRLAWVGTNGYVRVFDGTSNTADRTYTLPDLSGTMALTGAGQNVSFGYINSVANLQFATLPGDGTTTQANIIGWNRSGGVGEMNFINAKGPGSSGGFKFQSWDGTTLSDLVTITANNIAVAGTSASVFGGTIRAGAGSGETLTAGSVDVTKDIGIASTQGIVQGGTRIVTFTGGNVATSGNLAVGGTAESTIAGSLTVKSGGPPSTSVSQVHMMELGGQPSIDLVDASRTANNRIAEFKFSIGQLDGRFLNDAYSAAQTWLTVIGGQASGISGITLNGPITVTGNLNVSGTGTSSIAGSFGVGTNSPGINGDVKTITVSTGSTGGAASLELQGKQTVNGGVGGVGAYNQATRVGLAQWVRDGADTTSAFQLYTASAGSLAKSFEATPGGLAILNTSVVKGVRTSTATFNFGTISAGTSNGTGVSVSGVAVGDSPMVGTADGTAWPDGIAVQANAEVSNAITVRIFNTTGSSIVVGSRTFRVTVIQF